VTPRAAAEADALEAEGPQGRPLWGRTYAVKDNIDVAGLPTTAACPGYALTPAADAPAVARLRAAGALLIGKTNLDQFATGLVGVRSPYGTPRNVFSAAHVPGGSSSGSAPAVARIAVVPDPADPYSRTAPFDHLRRGALPPALRIGIASVAALCDPSVAEGYARTTALFTHTETVDTAPFLDIARLLYDGPWVAERTAALREVVETRPHILHPTTRVILESGLARRTVDAFDAFHRLAAVRALARDLFSRIDAMLLPTAPSCPTLADLEADPIGPNSRLGTFTNFVNLCDLAAIAVPAGFGPDGLPVGVTVLGPAWSEGRLAAIADRIHRAGTATIGATGRTLPPPAAPAAIAPGETGLFCIGAHMSGLPLNGQITALGGRFVREAHTEASYRLFALGNRPGLLRAAPGSEEGAPIAGEVWALPAAAIGPLLAQVPPPLGFGTVMLNDGPCLGFLAEAAGVAGAQDITNLGGWRAHLAG
jgi:allophanate hydrolase